MASAWRDSGTRWGRRIFIFSAGIRHSALSTSNSFHSAWRSSPGLTKTSGAKSQLAMAVIRCPSNPSMARSSAPIAVGSRMAARRLTLGRRQAHRADRSTSVSAFEARAVLIGVPNDQASRCCSSRQCRLIAAARLDEAQSGQDFGGCDLPDRTLAKRDKGKFKTATASLPGSLVPAPRVSIWPAVPQLPIERSQFPSPASQIFAAQTDLVHP